MPMTTRDMVKSARTVVDYGSGPFSFMKSDWRKDREMAELARLVALPSGGRAEEYFDHYLSGAGTPKTFSAVQFIDQNDGVSRRFSREILQFFNANNLRNGQTGVIGFGQQDVTTYDWKMATGSFPIKWTYLGARTLSDGDLELVFSVEGSNEYKWYPDDAKRETQLLHQAMDRLRQPRTNALDFLQYKTPARNFWMYATRGEYTLRINAGKP